MWFVKGFEALLHVKSLGNYYHFAKMISEKQPANTDRKSLRKDYFSNQSAVHENSY